MATNPPPPSEIIALFGTAGELVPKEPEYKFLFRRAFRAAYLKDKLENLRLFATLQVKAHRGDQTAAEALETAEWEPALASSLKAKIFVVTRQLSRVTSGLLRLWAAVGESLPTFCEQARQERLAKYGLATLTPPEGLAASGPTLAEVSQDLLAKKELLQLFDDYFGGKREALAEINKHGFSFQPWQDKEIVQEREILQKQIRQLGVRFQALKLANQQRLAQAQQEISEQIAKLQQRRRKLEQEIELLGQAQADLAKPTISRVEIARRLETVGVTLHDLPAAIDQRWAEVREVARALDRLAASPPAVGEKIGQRMAGVLPAEVPQLASLKELVSPAMAWATLEAEKPPTQWLAAGELRLSLAEEAEHLEGFLLGEESSRQFWRSRGAPAVWSRRDVEEALRSRMEILEKLGQKNNELAPPLIKRAEELFLQLKDWEKASGDDLALIAKAEVASLAEAREKLEAARSSGQPELALLWAGKRQQAKFTQTYGS